MIPFLVIILQSFAPLRHTFYEFFLHFHFALAVVAFVGLWYHLREFVHRWVFLAAVSLWILEVSNDCHEAKEAARQ